MHSQVHPHEEYPTASGKQSGCKQSLLWYPSTHAHLGLHIAVSLKGKTTHICSFSYGFVCATTMGYAGLELSFSIIIVL